MDVVEPRRFTVPDFALESGEMLAEVTLEYETYGRLSADGRNAILVTHGFTSSGHAAGKHTPADAEAGWWDGLIGPGKAIDTHRYFVVASNMLGSSYGSTGPASLDPATGRPYGPDFPAITLGDIVRAQRLLLDRLGVTHLVAVAGPSFGGYQAFQWAVTYPAYMDGIVAVVTAPKGSGGDAAVQALRDRFATDPNWNGGWHYDRGGIPVTMTEYRAETLRRYGRDEILAATMPDPAARDARIREMAEIWASEFDPNSLITLRRAAVRFDAERDVAKIRARVLYVLARTDRLFPPSLGPGVMAKLAGAGVDAAYVEIDTDFGHSASGVDWAKWAPALRDFLAKLEAA
ncbi:MAG: alpha/beta fold hydrolase [Candidatus Rokubacteria bacterium]|nr:alpha/beta fold hydrolase [Candidatus Rokubacteria bacterium]